MKIIIAGSRGINRFSVLFNTVHLAWNDVDSDLFGKFYTEIVSGGATGVDRMAIRLAQEENIKYKVFKPDWSIGRSAGMKRNIAMGDYADGLIALWDGKSKGTKHMIDYMKKLNKPSYVAIYG